MVLPFDIAGGSVAGRAHAAAGRNNQDAFCWSTSEAGIVAVVCDGCSSEPHSEVGAKVGARLVAHAAARLCGAKLGADDLLERVRLDVLARLRLLATEMGSETFQRTVAEYLLFTVVGVVVTATSATTFSMGDGLVSMNGTRRILGPFPNNEPPYLGYGLLSRGPSFEIHGSVPTDELERLVLATDGASDFETDEPLETMCDDDRIFRNPDMVRRRLTVMRQRQRGLTDDTTLIFVRRRRGEA
jgi:serine/threonine protein phosphatase PrpC